MTITLELTEEEIAVMAEMRRAGVFSSDLDVVKAGLFMYGMHFGIEMSSQCWAVGGVQADLFAPLVDPVQEAFVCGKAST